MAFRWYIVRETVAVVSQLSQKGLFVSLRRSFIGLQLVLLRTWQLVLGSHCDNFMLFSLKKNTYYCQTNQGVSIIKTAILAILTQLALTQQFNKPQTTRHHRFNAPERCQRRRKELSTFLLIAIPTSWLDKWVLFLEINITIIIMGALPRNQHHHNHRQLILQDENLSGYLGPGGAQPVAQCWGDQ